MMDERQVHLSEIKEAKMVLQIIKIKYRDKMRDVIRKVLRDRNIPRTNLQGYLHPDETIVVVLD